MKKYNSFLGAFFSGDNGQGGYNAAYEKKSLANLYGGQLAPEQEQEALAGLSRVNPEAAGKWQEETVKQSAQLLLALGKDNPVAQQAWQTRIKPNLSRMYGAQAASLPDQIDDNIMAVAQQIAGGQPKELPNKAQEADWAAKQQGFVPGSDEYKGFVGRYFGGDSKGPKMSLSDNDTPYDAENFRYYDYNTGRWISISPDDVGTQGQPNPKPTQTRPAGPVPQPTASGGKGIVFPSDVQGAAQRTQNIMTQVRQEIAALVEQGVPVDKATSQVTQKYAQSRGLTMPPVGQQPAPVQQTAPPVNQAAPPPVATGGQGRNPFAKPESAPSPATWNAPVVETRGGKQVRVRYGTYNGQPIEQVMGEAEITPDAPKPATADERSARGYLDRMAAAEAELDKLVTEGFTPNTRDFFTAGEGAALNWMSSPKGQVWKQQQEDWVRAKLRRESGAAIPPEEMDREIKTYFPQPGDSKAVIESKKKSREMARQQFITMAGSAAPSAPNKPAGGVRANPANLPAKNSKGWVLYTDKAGNKAYVSPDKKQYEVVE